MPRRFSFSVVSDMHVMAWKETNFPVEWIPSIEHSIRDIASLNPDFLVSNGDQTNGKERDWLLFSSILKKYCSFPVYLTMGNHEYYGYYEENDFSSKTAQLRFLQYSGHEAIYYEILRDGVQLIFMSTEKYEPSLNDAGWFSFEQLAWLEAKLSSSVGPAIVFLHQPLNETVADSVGTCVQSKEIKQILEKHPGTFIVSGHTHCRMDIESQIFEEKGIIYVGGGCLNGEYPQSRWFDINDDRITVKIRDHANQRWIDAYERTFPI